MPRLLRMMRVVKILGADRNSQGRAGANLIDFNDKFNSYEELEPVDQVTQVQNQLNSMTLDDKA